MRIAVACDGLVIAPYFVQCTGYMVYTVQYGRVVESRNLPALDQPISLLANVLLSLEIDTLIVGRIDEEMAAMLSSAGLEVVANAQDDPLVAVQDYLSRIFSAVED